jgi:hypothetical protein
MLACVFNQCKCHWLLSGALNFDISICLKSKKEFKISSSLDNFMEKESIVVLELGFLASNIRKKGLCLGFIFIFWENINKRKFITCCL